MWCCKLLVRLWKIETLAVGRKKLVVRKQEQLEERRHDIEVVSTKAGRSGHDDRAHSTRCLMTHTAAATGNDGVCVAVKRSCAG